MCTILSISTVMNNPGISTVISLYSVISTHDVISITSRDTVGDITHLLLNPYRCFWTSAHRRYLMYKSQFPFSNIRCSSAAIFSSSFIWDGSRGKNPSLMWNLFSSFYTSYSALFHHFFRSSLIDTCFFALCMMCTMS